MYLSKDQLSLFSIQRSRSDESVSVCGCRLEDLALQIVKQNGVSDHIYATDKIQALGTAQRGDSV